MSGSFERIDYSIRPAKHAERRMLCDIFRRLRPFGRIEEYLYVGFGSVWFADFSLFHRSLGVRDMISIEQEVEAKDRIEDNKPFRIPVDYRHSKHALPELDWTRRQFIWLDYDAPLSPDMLGDAASVARRAVSGTALAISIQCVRSPYVNEARHAGISAIERFTAVFGRERVPADAVEEDLLGWPFGALSRTMVYNEIQSALAARNAAGGKQFVFRPICDFEYMDGAKMTTIVGVFCEEEDLSKLADCNMSALEFVSADGTPTRITVPKLTVKEFRKLESQLPLAAGSVLELGTIPPAEAKMFEAFYRYLPNFSVVEG
ncbi:O-methyltransferase [Variovorax sp. 22077]|uniref:O-methyltransferase n=1 Tax=Variovorax sp. 22077 TaxID=3453867 RepID=UPI003F877400